MKKFFFVGLLFLFVLLGVGPNCAAQVQSRESLLKQIEDQRAVLQGLEDRYLAPPAKYNAEFAEFLRQPDTGLIRLLPREIYDKDIPKRLTVRGGGAFYSFTRLTHEYGFGTDLGLESNYLKVGFAGACYGFLVNLGDTPLNEATLDHPAARFMASHDAATEEPQARIEQRRFSSGITVDGFNYKERLAVVVNATYLLRSVYYSKSDVLVAFNVVRKDSDGSLIIRWQMLKKFPKPELKRNS